MATEPAFVVRRRGRGFGTNASIEPPLTLGAAHVYVRRQFALARRSRSPTIQLSGFYSVPEGHASGWWWRIKYGTTPVLSNDNVTGLVHSLVRHVELHRPTSVDADIAPDLFLRNSTSTFAYIDPQLLVDVISTVPAYYGMFSGTRQRIKYPAS